MKKQDIEDMIRREYGDCIVELNVTEDEGMCLLRMQYKDGSPLADVRRFLNDNIDNLWSMDVERVYSDEAIQNELMKLYEEDDHLAMRVEAELMKQALVSQRMPAE